MTTPHIPMTALAGWTVVVIDDEPDSLLVAMIMLEAYGAIVHTASNGIEGLAKVREVLPRFVICDLSMPIMDGWTIIAEAKNDVSLLAIPMLALTAHAMSGDRERALAAGFASYLTKPLSAETFIQHLVKALREVEAFADELNFNEE